MSICTFWFVCGMTIGVTSTGFEVTALKWMVWPESVPFKATKTEAPAGRVTLEIEFRPTVESNRRHSSPSNRSRRARAPAGRFARLLDGAEPLPPWEYLLMTFRFQDFREKEDRCPIRDLHGGRKARSPVQGPSLQRATPSL